MFGQPSRGERPVGRFEGAAQERDWRKHRLVRVREGVLDAIARTRLLAGHPLWAGP
jgi:hypothetical protein